tara:strand:+ start:191 stop:547 length:357 start_codon:yes stop_codon:yes gene_type:complete
MGDYIYKVTGKTRVLPCGTKANIAVFAYKPYQERMFDDHGKKINKKLYYETGCYRADKYAEKNTNYTGLVTIPISTDEDWYNEKDDIPVPLDGCGHFTDSWYDYCKSKIIERKEQVNV